MCFVVSFSTAVYLYFNGISNFALAAAKAAEQFIAIFIDLGLVWAGTVLSEQVVAGFFELAVLSYCLLSAMDLGGLRVDSISWGVAVVHHFTYGSRLSKAGIGYDNIKPQMPVILQSTLGVFLGTLALLGAIVWAAFQQSQRISRLETQFDSLNHRMNAQFDSLGTKMDKLIAQGAEQNERIAVIETKIDGPRLVAH